MALPNLITAEHIKKLEAIEQEKYHKVLDNYHQNRDAADGTKELWLGVYARCLSPSIACWQSGVSLATYKRWRSTDAAFCRGLNNIIVEAKEELIGSVLSRATGYTQACDIDDPTESGHKEDSSGKVIRYGASDQLARSILQLDDNKKDKNSGASVTVVIDMGALTGRASSKGLVFDEVGNVINADRVEGDAIDAIESGSDAG